MSIARKSSPDLGGWSSGNGVGLSNPQLAQGRRTMLDLVNRLHSTGSVFSFFFFLWISGLHATSKLNTKTHGQIRICLSLFLSRLIFLARRSIQCASRHWSPPNCCHWLTECWKVLAHWSHIRNHSASCSWDLYTVRKFLFCVNFLTSHY